MDAIRRLHAPLAGVLALALLPGCGGKDQDRDAALYDVSSAPPRYLAVAQAFASEARASGIPGAAMGIIEGGELVYAVGVGRKDPSGDLRVGPGTLFRIGSVNKMMTALAVLTEVDAGNLALGDAVVEHVPGFHLDGDDVSEITVGRLLDHSTGLLDYLELDAPPAEQTDAALEGFLTGRFAGIGYLMAPPGRFYNYSNPNFMLAGLVAETTSGTPYRQLMEERVFTPLGMARTFFLGDEVLSDGDFAVASTRPGLGVPARVEPDSYDNPWGRPAGYAWSNVADLARFARFLVDGDAAVLAPALHAQMTSPERDTQELLDLIHYGFGLQTSSGFFLGDGFHAVKIIAHSGGIPGFAANLVLLPGTGFGLVTLASGDGAYFQDTLVKALGLPTLPAPVEPPDITPDPATFQEEVGVYEDPNLVGTVTVSLSAGNLRVDMPAADALGIAYHPVLVPVSPRNFLFWIEGTQFPLTFIHGAPGEPTWLRTRPFVAERAALPGVRAAAPAPSAERVRAAFRAARSLAPERGPLF
jgi:CubicO group peptidase (beta-lactamase class C family)